MLPCLKLVLCLQEKEIMKELMENGPVQGEPGLENPHQVLLEHMGGGGVDQLRTSLLRIRPLL